MTQEQAVNLDTIGAGALRELFAAELSRVLQNIVDPNTDDVSKRQITMTVTLKPNRDRNQAKVDLKCGSKLAGIRSVETNLHIGMVRGKLIAVENDPRQIALFDPPKIAAVASNVTPITQQPNESR